MSRDTPLAGDEVAWKSGVLPPAVATSRSPTAAVATARALVLQHGAQPSGQSQSPPRSLAQPAGSGSGSELPQHESAAFAVTIADDVGTSENSSANTASRKRWRIMRGLSGRTSTTRKA